MTNRFRTIQEIETLNLDTLSIPEVNQLRKDLHNAFYYTRSSEMTSDGRCLKDVIGQQDDRVLDYISGTHGSI